MIPVLSRAQMRAYDTHAIERCRVPGLVLMENAGRGASEIIGRLLGEELLPAVIVCGRGNNGGDGFVVARHLLASGREVEVFVVGERRAVSGDARAMLEAFEGIGGTVEEIHDDLGSLRAALARGYLAVDAIFGTGLERPVQGVWAEVVNALGQAPCPCVSLDLPSGIDADTGAILGRAVRASVTITFGCVKPGLLQGAGLERAGEVHTVGLGIADEAIVEAVGASGWMIAGSDVGAVIGRRPLAMHKYRAGSVLLVAGSPGKTGAASLAASAALRTGAGLATIATWPAAADLLDGRAMEVMTARLDPDDLEGSLASALHKRTAVGIGPGLGLDADARRVVDAVVLGFPGPVVVDADAISAFAGRAQVLKSAPGPRILTPHAGELARLLAEPIDDDRFVAATHAAELTGCVVVLKGPHTVIATPSGDRFVCGAAEPLLATAGAGDVLTGMVTALAGSGEDAECAAYAAVHLHARAAELWRRERPLDRGLIAGDLLGQIPEAIAEALTD